MNKQLKRDKYEEVGFHKSKKGTPQYYLDHTVNSESMKLGGGSTLGRGYVMSRIGWLSNSVTPLCGVWPEVVWASILSTTKVVGLARDKMKQVRSKTWP